MSVKVDRYRAEVGEDGPCPPKTRCLKPLNQEESPKSSKLRHFAEESDPFAYQRSSKESGLSPRTLGTSEGSDSTTPRSCLRKQPTNEIKQAEEGPSPKSCLRKTSTKEVDESKTPRSCLRKSSASTIEESASPKSCLRARTRSSNEVQQEATTPRSCLRKRSSNEGDQEEAPREPSFPSCLKSSPRMNDTNEPENIPSAPVKSALRKGATQDLAKAALRTTSQDVDKQPIVPIKSALRKAKTVDTLQGREAAETLNVMSPPTPSSSSTAPRKKFMQHRLSAENIEAVQAALCLDKAKTATIPPSNVKVSSKVSKGSLSEMWDGDVSEAVALGSQDPSVVSRSRCRGGTVSIACTSPPLSEPDTGQLPPTLQEKLKSFAEPMDMKERRPEFWSVRHICMRAFYKASQADAWQMRGSQCSIEALECPTARRLTPESPSMGGMLNRRLSKADKTIVVRNLDDEKEPSSPGVTARPKFMPKLCRSTSVFIVDEEEENAKTSADDEIMIEVTVPKPPGETGAPKGVEALVNDSTADTGGTPRESMSQVSPLKELLTVKKVNVEHIKALLENLSPIELEFWIDAPLDPAQSLPPPLFFAIGATLPAVVGLLLEFSADVRKQYVGQKLYNGWIKPGASSIEAVTARRGRFVGTMLGDRLDTILELLKLAESNYQDGEDKKAAESEKLREEIEVRIDKITKKEQFSEGRKSIMLNGARGEIEHTQGHPREKYDVMGELGEGHLTSVKEALYRKTGERRAIKAQMKIEEGMMWEEIAIIRKLDHPNVIQLYETFEDECNIFVVLELCVGGELFDTLALQGGIPESGAARLMAQLADAVRYLHTSRICHRDIQPENLLLKDQGNIRDTCVKLIDFATAKEFGPNIEMKTKICSLYYVAPEILTRKSIPYSEKIDVWSLGVLFFMILSGCPPFHAENELETLKLVKKGSLKFSPPDIWDCISVSAKDLISKMLVVDAVSRFSAEDVSEHVWLVSNANRTVSRAHNHLVTSDQLNQLRNFHARNRVQKIVLRLKENKLSDEAIEEIRRMFQRLDRDGTGEVHISHIRDQIRRIPAVKENMEEIMRVLWSLEGGTGKVMFDKFLTAMVDRHKSVQKDACRAIFDVFDFDASGKISKEELHGALGLDAACDSASFLSGVETVFGVKATDIENKLSLNDAHEYTFDEFFDLLQMQV